MNALATAKLAVMQEASYIKKQRTAGLNYSFAGMDAIIEKLRPVMIAHGLSVCPVAYVIHADELFTTAKGSQMRHILVTGTFRMTHAPSGEFEDIVTLGEAMDSGDKAANKAMTASAKYAILQAFLLERGDDADPDAVSSAEYERPVPLALPPREAPMTVDSYKQQLLGAPTLAALQAAWLVIPSTLKADCELSKDNRKAVLSAKH